MIVKISYSFLLIISFSIFLFQNEKPASKIGSLLKFENIKRAKNKPYASVQDANMFVCDHFYGIDMADAIKTFHI